MGSNVVVLGTFSNLHLATKHRTAGSRAALQSAIAIQATLWLIKIISDAVVSTSQLLLSRINFATGRKNS